MQFNNFHEYLVKKFGQNEAEFYEDGCIETVLPLGDGEDDRIVVFYPDDMLSLSVFYGTFKSNCEKALHAFIDGYNEREDRTCELRYLDGQIWAEIDEFGVDDQRAIAIIDGVIDFFTSDNEVTKTLRDIASSADARGKIVHERVCTLKTRAFALEEAGKHEDAMEIFHSICEDYYGYGHMELIAMCYGHKTKWGEIPFNAEHQLECQMLAVERCPEDKYAVMGAYRMARDLGKAELCERLLGIGLQRGSWDMIALHLDSTPIERLQRIARCYREGIGCEPSEAHASFYDRLIAGERQAVFHDMLTQGFKPVFNLMDGHNYYHATSLQELDCFPAEMRQLFLYGDEPLHLPNWFVPFVNGLPAEERDEVLRVAKAKLTAEVEAVLARLEAGELVPLKGGVGGYGIFVEDCGSLQFLFTSDLSDLTDCDLKAEILALLQDFRGRF